MDIRIVTIADPHHYTCGAETGWMEQRKPCGEPAIYLLQNNRAAKRNEPSIGYVCDAHLGNVVEWYVSEDRR